jgi:hypothetical protein
MKKLALLIFLIVALPATPSTVQAEDGPCKADIEKFCKDVKKGEGRIIKCLKEHQSELSPECKARGADLKAEAKDVRKACKQDVENFCKDVRPGGGRILKCMKENEAKLSTECKKERDKARATFDQPDPSPVTN